MTDISERTAKLEAWKDGHEDRCKERYDANAAALTTLNTTLATLTTKVDGAFSRAHERIDGLKIWVLTGAGGLLLTILAYVLTTWGPLAK